MNQGNFSDEKTKVLLGQYEAFLVAPPLSDLWSDHSANDHANLCFLVDSLAPPPPDFTELYSRNHSGQKNYNNKKYS